MIFSGRDMDSGSSYLILFLNYLKERAGGSEDNGKIWSTIGYKQ